MSPAMNYTEIQQDEVEALASIFMEEFHEEEAKTGAWNVGFLHSPNFSGFNLLFLFVGCLIGGWWMLWMFMKVATHGDELKKSPHRIQKTARD